MINLYPNIVLNTIMPVFAQDCPVWRPWSQWTECSRTCGGGIRRHVRFCSGSFAGVYCTGDAEEIQECNNNVSGVFFLIPCTLIFLSIRIRLLNF